MTNKYTDDVLIKEYVRIANYVAQQEMELKVKLEKAAAGMEALKAELAQRMTARGATQIKTDTGTVYFSDHLNIKVVNRDALLDYAREHWTNGGGALVVIKPPVDAVKDYQAMNGGKLPPGIETTTHTRINIRPGAK